MFDEKKYGAEYRKRNAEKLRLRSHQWYLDNHSYRLSQDKEKRQSPEYKQRMKDYLKKYYLKNKDRMLKQNKQNRQSIRSRALKMANHRKKLVNDPNYKLEVALRGRLNSLFRKGIRMPKLGRTMSLVGCDINTVREHLEKQFKDGMDWHNHGEWHIDHITPISSFNLLDIEEQKKAFHYTNLQPLWSKDNLKKGKKIVMI